MNLQLFSRVFSLVSLLLNHSLVDREHLPLLVYLLHSFHTLIAAALTVFSSLWITGLESYEIDVVLRYFLLFGIAISVVRDVSLPILCKRH
jgi:hypothetical protein